MKYLLVSVVAVGVSFGCSGSQPILPSELGRTSADSVAPQGASRSIAPRAVQEVVGGRRFTTTLTGAAEAPGPGDPDGSGMAILTLNAGRGEVCFKITVNDIAPVRAAHIHEAPVGEPGPVVITLTTTGQLEGCVPADPEEILETIREPEEYYVNVHNADFPAGALRGQLSR